MPAREIWRKLCAGEVAERKVTFPEGFAVESMAERLARELHVDKEGFLRAARGSEVTRRLPFPLPRGKLEGYLYPSTYAFRVDARPGELVGQMLAGFSGAFWVPHEAEVRRSKLSLHKIVTLASLVEKEAKLDAERRLIAGVLMNRLQRGMLLQCDATVQYALGEHRTRLLYSDLKVNSPYNTYLHKGLPPGPICNPGLACLEAALSPERTDYLFYVARPDGGHVFSKTYEEHLAAIKKLRGGNPK